MSDKMESCNSFYDALISYFIHFLFIIKQTIFAELKTGGVLQWLKVIMTSTF